MPRVAKKTSTRAKPKSAKNAASKKVSRVAPRKTTTAAKRATASKRTASATKAAPKASPKQTVNRQAASADAMLKMGADAVRDLLGNNANSAQLLQVSKEGAEQIARQADAASRSLGEVFSISKESVDTCVECSNIAVNTSKHIGAEWFNYANRSFSQNVEFSKELFGCRTLNDMFDLQSKALKTNMDTFFNESVKMSEMAFACATQVSEPLNERVSEATNRLTKALADAA